MKGTQLLPGTGPSAAGPLPFFCQTLFQSIKIGIGRNVAQGQL